MSSTTDEDESSTEQTATYKSVASIKKINVAHDIVVKDFEDWRNNVELLGPLDGLLDLPFPNDNIFPGVRIKYGGTCSKINFVIFNSKIDGLHGR